MAGQRRWWVLGAGVLAASAVVLWLSRHDITARLAPSSSLVVSVPPRPLTPTSAEAQNLRQLLATAASAQIGVTLGYDPAYVRLAYPGGDVPMDRGVCSDVVVRAFRQVGWDLQACLHQDMKAAFAAYPTRWGLKRPDANIDHRRVLNLMTWFNRQQWSVPMSTRPQDYLPGDIVAWDLGGGLTHIGIVVADDQQRPRIVHNIGQGARLEDVLFAWTQIGHYRLPLARGALPHVPAEAPPRIPAGALRPGPRAIPAH